MVAGDVHDDLGGVSYCVVDIFETVVPRAVECGLVGNVFEAQLRAEKRLLFQVAMERGRVLPAFDASEDVRAEDGTPGFRVALIVVVLVVEPEVRDGHFSDEVL